MAAYDCLYIIPSDVFKSMEEKTKNVEVTNIISTAPPGQNITHPSNQPSSINQMPNRLFRRDVNKSGKEPRIKRKQDNIRREFIPSSFVPQGRILDDSRQIPSAPTFSQTKIPQDQVEDMDIDDVQSLNDVEMQSVMGEDVNGREEGDKDRKTKLKNQTDKENEQINQVKKEKKEEKKNQLKKAMKQEEDEEMKEVINDRLDTLLGKKKDSKPKKESTEKQLRKERYKMYHNKLLHEVRHSSPYYRGKKDGFKRERPEQRKNIKQIAPSFSSTKKFKEAVKRKRDINEDMAQEEHNLGRRTKRVQKSHPFFIAPRQVVKRRGVEEIGYPQPWKHAFTSDIDYASQPKIGNMRYAPVSRPFPGIKRKNYYDDYEEEERETGIPFKSRGVQITQEQNEAIKPENQPLPLDFLDDDVIMSSTT